MILYAYKIQPVDECKKDYFPFIKMEQYSNTFPFTFKKIVVPILRFLIRGDGFINQTTAAGSTVKYKMPSGSDLNDNRAETQEETVQSNRGKL